MFDQHQQWLLTRTLFPIDGSKLSSAQGVPVKLDFFIVGAQKAGTTALDSFLRAHPSVQMAKTKEIHFFDKDDVDWVNPDYGHLHRHFDWTVSDVVRGEATPSYIFWPPVMQRIRDYNPDARIIVLLRHPITRAFSHWKQIFSKKKEPLLFQDAIRSGRDRPPEHPFRVHRTFSCVERGFYSIQVERLLGLFPERQTLFLKTEFLWGDCLNTLNRVEDFLGVPRRSCARSIYITPRATIWADPKISEEDYEYLRALFVEDIKKTAALTGLNLDDWLRPNYEEPMAPD